MSSASEPIRVLHVDDEPHIAELAASYLEREHPGFTVETASGVTEALTRLDGRDFDCVVSDYDMPDRNGIEFLDAVRERSPELPFILFTGKGSEEVASDAISAGVTDYLQKETGTSQFELLANRVLNAVEQWRARQAVEETEFRLRTLAENTADILWQFTADWNELLFINSAYEEIWGRSTTELRDHPRSFLKGIHPDDRELVEDAMERLSAGESVDLEFRVNADEDFGRWVWAKGQPITDEEDIVSRVAGFVRDITDWKARETELRQKTRAIEAAPIGITLSDPDQPDNPLVYANPQFLELTGYTEAEAIGRNCRFLQGDGTDDAAVAAMRQGIEDAAAVTVELLNYRADGTEFWNRVSIAPIFDADGHLTNFVGFQEDVTARREQELEREQTLRFLQMLYDVATDPGLDKEAKISRLLSIGHEELDLPYGHLTRIRVDEQAADRGSQTIIQATGDHELLQPGDASPLEVSYCRKTIRTDGLLEVRDAQEAGWGGDPAYGTFELECYIGTKITVHDDLYGTVFFAAPEPREEPFTNAERTFVKLLSQLVQYELERDLA